MWVDTGGIRRIVGLLEPIVSSRKSPPSHGTPLGGSYRWEVGPAGIRFSRCEALTGEPSRQRRRNQPGAGDHRHDGTLGTFKGK